MPKGQPGPGWRYCNAHNRRGEPCRGKAMKGLDKCHMHIGISRQKAKAKGLIRVALEQWGLDGHTTMADAGEVLLRLVTQSAWRCETYGRLLGAAYEAAEHNADLDEIMRGSGGIAALIGWKYDLDRLGQRVAVEEAIRGLVQLEMAERKFCVDASAKAIAAGLAERQVRLAERQGVLIVAAMRNILDELRLTPEQQAAAAEIVGRNLRAIAGEVVDR
jgi:hypothetical protein